MAHTIDEYCYGQMKLPWRKVFARVSIAYLFLSALFHALQFSRPLEQSIHRRSPSKSVIRQLSKYFLTSSSISSSFLPSAVPSYSPSRKILLAV